MPLRPPIKKPAAAVDPDVPEFPEVTPGPTIAEMYARDDASPHHRSWGGKTSAEARAEEIERTKDNRGSMGWETDPLLRRRAAREDAV